MTDHRILVLMPCLNEEGRVGSVIESVRRVLPDADVAVIDDASTDGTIREAEARGAFVLEHGCNLGYGAALETGYLHAVRHNYDVVLQMDGDGQHPAEDLARLLAPILERKADIVIGSRYLGQSNDHGTPLLRRIGHRVFASLIFLLTRLRLTDPTSGLHGLNRRAFTLFASGVFPCDYPDSDVILMAHMCGLRILELPVEMRPREGGISMHSGLKPVYYAVKMLLSMFIVLLNFRLWRQWQSRNARSGITSAPKG